MISCFLKSKPQHPSNRDGDSLPKAQSWHWQITFHFDTVSRARKSFRRLERSKARDGLIFFILASEIPTTIFTTRLRRVEDARHVR